MSLDGRVRGAKRVFKLFAPLLPNQNGTRVWLFTVG